MTALANGLGGISGFGENYLDRNDDESTEYIDLTSVFGSGLNFFGSVYQGFWLNNNGGVTFAGPRSDFTPDAITGATNNPNIVAFYADVDTRTGTDDVAPGTVPPTPGGTSTGADIMYYDLDAATNTFTATWDDVGYFSAHTDKLNSFQLEIKDASGAAGRAAGDFDITFRYEDINWVTGDASQGTGGLGGVVAVAGYTSGTGVEGSYYELPASHDENAMRDLESSLGNTGIAGLWQFQVRNGAVVEASNLVISALQDSKVEGNSGTSEYSFTVTRSGDTSTAVSVDYQTSGSGEHGASASDFLNGTLPTGTLNFAAGETTKTITIQVLGDGSVEFDEDFTVALLNGSPTVAIIDGDATSKIVNDDSSGPDFTHLGGGNNEVDYHTNTSGVVIDADGGDDRVVGGRGNDIIYGSAGNDRLVGNNGNDILAGGAGADRMQGGQGDDTFRFSPGDLVSSLGSANGFAGQLDHIIDFEGAGVSGGDVIELSGFGAGAQLTFSHSGSNPLMQYYHVIDGANSGWILVQMSGTTNHLGSGDFAFL